MSDTSLDYAESVPSEVADIMNESSPDLSPESIQQRIAGDRPSAPTPPDSVVELVRGYWANGKWNRDVTVRELTGIDEEMLSRMKTERDIFDGIIALGTERIGSVELRGEPLSARTEVLDSLLLGERSQIYMAVNAATFGDEKTLEITCGNCQTEQETTLILSEDFPLHVKDEGVRDEYTYVTSKGEKIVYRLMTGHDMKAAEERPKASQSEKNSIGLSCVIQSVDGKTPIDMEAYVKSLGMRDRVKILESLNEEQPYIDLTLNVTCIGCGEGQQIPLQWADLFRP